MNNLTRRQFIQLLAGSSILTSTFGPLIACSSQTKNTSTGRVVIVGGGFGGSTCAKYLQRFDPSLEIILIEPAKSFFTCPFSNTVLAGMNDMSYINHPYDAHIKRGVRVIHALVTDIDPPSNRVTLSNGDQISYDRLVLSPGIDFRWEAVEGMQADDAAIMPHAWQAGKQTQLLRQQLHAMKNGDIVVMAVPDNPFRCPPGPYERASMMAYYLQQHKPKSKLIILDAKDKFSKQPLFMDAWQQRYPGLIEWVSGSQGGRIDYVDVANRTLHTEAGDSFQPDVINFIPPQKAGILVVKAGLTNDDGWCPVNQRTFESKFHADIHVIGDASIAGAMPKSGFAANSQGKVCAAAIVSALHGTTMPTPSYVNTCYSLVAPDYGISVAAVYRYNDDKGIYKIKDSGGVSPRDANAEFRQQEARYAAGWYASITSDAFD